MGNGCGEDDQAEGGQREGQSLTSEPWHVPSGHGMMTKDMDGFCDSLRRTGRCSTC